MAKECIRIDLHGYYCISKGRHISILLMNLHLICTNALVGDHLVLKKKTPFWDIKVESDDGGHLESIDALGPGRRILTKCCNQVLTVKR